MTIWLERIGLFDCLVLMFVTNYAFAGADSIGYQIMLAAHGGDGGGHGASGGGPGSGHDTGHSADGYGTASGYGHQGDMDHRSTTAATHPGNTSGHIASRAISRGAAIMGLVMACLLLLKAVIDLRADRKGYFNFCQRNSLSTFTSHLCR